MWWGILEVEGCSAFVVEVGMEGCCAAWYEHLHVHWPVGQAHELPQLQVHPGPMVGRVSVPLLALRESRGKPTHIDDVGYLI